MVLRKHRLKHIPELRVTGEFLEARFPANCAMSHCRGTCCKAGVWLDPTERDKILKHDGRVRKHMDSNQEKNPERWFTQVRSRDADFPSGYAVGTRVRKGACVFLNAEGRCVLQKASSKTLKLKPFFCVAFPVTIDRGELVLEEPRDPLCCTPEPNGELTVFDVCSEEIEYVLGREGRRALVHSTRTKSGIT